MSAAPETRKQKEIEHYDALARQWLKAHTKNDWESDAGNIKHSVFASYQFCEEWITRHVKRGDKLLDYGCGNGIHAILPAKLGAHVVGIDLSKDSLAIARMFAREEGVEKNVRFIEMDCEKLQFPDNSFEIIFDGGSFSSLDLKKAIPELARVLKPDGALLATETLGHNPLTNLKRRLNKLLGTRTGWAANHIFKIKDLVLMGKHFEHIETHFFHLLSLFAFPFLSLPGGILLLHTLEKLDSFLLWIPFLQRYAFKIVIIASKPKK